MNCITFMRAIIATRPKKGPTTQYITVVPKRLSRKTIIGATINIVTKYKPANHL